MLNAKQQHEMQHELGLLRQLAHPLGDLHHVDGAEGPVDHRDRGEEEDRRDQRDDDVDDAGADPRLGAAQRDQHVRGDEQDLEADVEVEQVAGDEGVEDARRQDQVRRVEDRDRGVVVVVRGALPDREEQDREQHDARDDHQQRREPVDVQHDPERDRPAADRDRDRLIRGVDDHEQDRRDHAHDAERHHRHDDLGAAMAARDERDRRAEQWQGHQQRYEGGRDSGHPSSPPRAERSSAGRSTGASSRMPAKSRSRGW